MTDTHSSTDRNKSTDPDRALVAVSQALVNARLKATPLAAFPGELPKSQADAYRVQHLSINAWPDTVRGWKVGGIPDAQREPGGAGRLAGPIFTQTVFEPSDGETVTMSIFEGGFAAVEAEFVIVIAEDIVPRERGYSDDELKDLIGAVHMGAEIASSPLGDINRIGPPAIISDFGNNAGLVVGPAIDDWRTRTPDSVAIRVSIDGAIIGDGHGVNGAPLAAMRFLVEHCATHGIALNAGDFISTGAVTGIHELGPGASSVVEFPGVGALSIAFVAKDATG